ncbi:unnamed protein product [Ilex paraguariensis]|uniref:SOUL heme-binding protein n=1 Tax=Ilex paraguariensis TaxID=185542 RepID=A0ABC8SBF6_9AQUA
MATSHLSDHICRPIPHRSASFRRLTTTNTTIIFLSPPKCSKSGSFLVKTDQKSKWVVRLSLVEQNPPKPTVDMKRLVDFLYDDFPHIFNDQGTDRTAYDERVTFLDPITKFDSISGYLFNIAMLKKLFSPDLQLHWVKQDHWDSIQNNDYFSLEGLLDVIKQLRIYETPDLETPKYQLLKRTGKYEVRKYKPFIVVEADGDKLAGSTGFNGVTGYIFGKNSTAEKIPMTTPIFTEAFDADMSKVSIQIVLPSEKDMSSLPYPSQEAVRLRRVEGGIAAVSKFSGELSEDIVLEKEKALRSCVIRDGLKPKLGCLLARYNDPGRTWSSIMRHEVLIWLEEFAWD